MKILYFSAKGLRNENNPFKIPADSEIFTFKERQKKEKQEERKKNSRLKAWEKDQPIRKGILRAIRETEIGMADELLSEDFKRHQHSYNVQYDKIPVDTMKKRESRHNLLERNKDIFLIAQMLSIKHDEIQKLEDFQTLRSEGLK